MLILAIETSCDETSAAVVLCEDNVFTVKSNIISSQIEFHQKFGGVVPENASRMHIECVSQVVDDALAVAEVGFDDVDSIAVTHAPGLVGALLVGVSYAKSLAAALGKPLIAVHHIEGHICANYITSPELKPPYVCLVASGGHSTVVKVSDYIDFTVLAKTRDDAAGEAFDKIARVLGLGYPGGPLISKAAEEGGASVFIFPRVRFDDSLDFSFSGVKTAVINTVHKLEQKNELIPISDIAASFQSAVCEVLASHLIYAALAEGVSDIALAGGVAANKLLRELASRYAERHGIKLHIPTPILCTDNAAMIAVRGYFSYIKGEFAGSDLNAIATKNIELHSMFKTRQISY